MSITKNGLLHLAATEYHAHSAVGHSSLVRLLRSPAHFQNYLVAPHEPTPAMQFGTAFHAALLEPEAFAETYVVVPKFDRRTKEGKESAARWESENVGKTALTDEQMSALHEMTLNVRQHSGASRLLSQGQAEMSCFWLDAETGIECKCRPDFLASFEEQFCGIVDVKTCCDASAEGFSRSIVSFGYDVQAAFYQDGLKLLTGRTLPFYFLAVEKEAPFAIAVYQASEDLIEIGRAKYRGALQLLRWCRDRGEWPGYQPGGEIETITLPRWAMNFDIEH